MRQMMDMIRRSVDPDAQWAGNNGVQGAGFLTDGYKRATCDKWHADLRLSFAADSPGLYSNMNREERDAGCAHGSDHGLRLEPRSGITRERAGELAAFASTSNPRACAKPCGCLVFRELQLIRLDFHSFSTAIELSYISS